MEMTHPGDQELNRPVERESGRVASVTPSAKSTEKFRPNSLQEVLGNGKAISELREWAESWEQDRPVTRAAILYGPAGTARPLQRWPWQGRWIGRGDER